MEHVKQTIHNKTIRLSTNKQNKLKVFENKNKKDLFTTDQYKIIIIESECNAIDKL